MIYVELKEVAKETNRINDNIEKVIRGKRQTVELAVTSFICGGHILIEDMPGVGKTMLAKAIARSINGSFKRIQFTPDLLPSDITGTSMFNQKTSDFAFSPGPVFANIVLADEINRTTPRTQSALLEAMDERQVTVDGIAHMLPEPFFVIATQNPMEYHGTYPLPEGQLDRFMMSLDLGYPDIEDEKDIIKSQQITHPIDQIAPVASIENILLLQDAVRRVYIDESLVDYTVRLVTATRDDKDLVMGASPRGSLAIMRASQGVAAAAGRDFVLPDDIKKVAVAALKHRVFPKQQLRMGKTPVKAILTRILEEIPVPVEKKV